MTLVFALLAVAAGVVPLWPVFGSVAFVMAAIGGTLFGAGVGALVRWRKWPWWAAIPTLVVVFAVCGVPLAVPQAALWRIFPTVAGEQQLFVSAVTGWKEVVTITPPVGDYAGLLVPVLILTLVGSTVVVLLARLRRAAAVTVLPGLAVLGVSIWLGVADRTLVLPAGIAVAALSLGVFIMSARGTVVRRVIAAGLVVAGLVIATSTSLIVTGAPAIWRDRVTPTLDQASLPSPLSDYRAYTTGLLSTEPMLTATGLKPGQMLTLATLSRYDGVTYSVGAPDADFTRQSGFARTDAAGAAQTQISIEQLTGPWLPLPGTFTGLADANTVLESLYYSPQAATAIDLTGLTAGLTYSVSGIPVQRADVQSLASAEPGTATTAVLDVPSGVESFVSAHASTGDSPGTRLVDVLSALTTNGYLSHGGDGESPSRSGHSAERITALLTDRVMVGDAEQYAVAGALLAQQVGFPARVVVGFVMPDSGTLIRGSDMGAWLQIATTEGWTTVDPTPAYRPIPEAPPDDPQKVSPPQPAVEPPPADTTALRDNTAPRSDERDPVAPPDPWRDILLSIATWVGWIAVAAAALLLPPVSIVIVKAMRRRRRRDVASARSSVLGARNQLADVLVDARGAVTPASTNRDLAVLAERRESPLVALADRAEYSSEAVTRRDAEVAWAEVDSIERQLSAPLTRRETWARRLSLRSFRRRR